MIRRHSGGSGAVRTRSLASGTIVIKEPVVQPCDLPRTGPQTPPGRDVVELLDGEVSRGPCGFSAITYEGDHVHRVLHVPYHVTDEMETALLLTRKQGCVAAKLARMDDLAGRIAYACTLAKAEPPD